MRDRDSPPLLDYYTDEPVSSVRSRTMSRIRGKDTSPEMELRRALWRLGVRYRCHPKGVPGRPDICNQKARVAIFVDGCFWHGCPRHFKAPKTRREFWTEKIRRNNARREEVIDEFNDQWTIFQYFECELKHGVESAAQEIHDAIEAGPRMEGR